MIRFSINLFFFFLFSNRNVPLHTITIQQRAEFIIVHTSYKISTRKIYAKCNSRCHVYIRFISSIYHFSFPFFSFFFFSLIVQWKSKKREPICIFFIIYSRCANIHIYIYSRLSFFPFNLTLIYILHRSYFLFLIRHSHLFLALYLCLHNR